eukprot:7890143-Lingulodinium_polyedra.AAC.1
MRCAWPPTYSGRPGTERAPATSASAPWAGSTGGAAPPVPARGRTWHQLPVGAPPPGSQG